MNFQVVGENTRYFRGVFQAPHITTEIQVLEEGSKSSFNRFYIETGVTRGSLSSTMQGEEDGLHYFVEMRRRSGIDDSAPNILGRVYVPENRNLLEQLSCCTEIHFNALREFRSTGKIPKLNQKMVDEYFSSLDEKNLVTNPESCD